MKSSRRRPRLTYANVTATIAIFLALGGGTTAIALSGKNSVRADDIARNAVREQEIARGAVGGGELRTGIIAPEHLRAGIISPEHIQLGAVGSDAIADGGVKEQDLSNSIGLVRMGLNGGHAQMPMPGPPMAGGFQTVDTETFNATRQTSALVQGMVEVSDTDDGTDGRFDVRVSIDGVPEPGVFSQTVPDGSTATLPVSIQCNGHEIPVGDHTVTLEVAMSQPGSFGEATLGVVSFKPIPSPP